MERLKILRMPEINRPSCHCGAIMIPVYDRCSEDYIWSCPRCSCRYKLDGTHEPLLMPPVAILGAFTMLLPLVAQGRNDTDKLGRKQFLSGATASPHQRVF
jgi:hypothetical protein